MNILERSEGAVIREGAQVTSTPNADYFYFRKDHDIVCVRLPKCPPEPRYTPIEVADCSIDKWPDNEG